MTDHNIKLIFIINGQDWTVETNLQKPLGSAAEKALAASHNTGRPLNEWEVRDAQGVLLETHPSAKDLGLADGSKLFLSLRVGAGGANAAESAR